MAHPAPTLLAAYDAQLRAHVPRRLPDGVVAERDGPLVRLTGFSHGGFVGYRDLEGLEGAALDRLIAAQRDRFAARGEPVEWKHHGHDQPADLPERLAAAGFEPQEVETVVAARTADVAAAPAPPAGVTLRETTSRSDLDRIVALQRRVWDEDWQGLADDLERELAADPDGLTVVLAEAGERLVCAGWIRFVEGTDFATLWGGGTDPDFRRRGIYRALVQHRARLAAARVYRYLQVDASDDSRPILERLSFVPLTTTTPYVWSPPA
jgi:ribosomal protein S18 acetylase RimI-like enzyme